jgi:hypothetical protein
VPHLLLQVLQLPRPHRGLLQQHEGRNIVEQPVRKIHQSTSAGGGRGN